MDAAAGTLADTAFDFDTVITDSITLKAKWEQLVPEFTTHSLLLSGEIGVNFFMNLPEIPEIDYSTAYMEFRVNAKGEQIVTIDRFDPNDRDVNGRGYYGFTCFVNAIQMAEPVTAIFHYGSGQTVQSTYSVKDYIVGYEEIADGQDKTTTALVHALADYGHYTQLSLSESNGWTIGTDYAEMDVFYTTSVDVETAAAEASDYKITWKYGTSDIESIDYAVSLLSRTVMYFYLTPKEGYAGPVEATVDGQPAEAQKLADGRYRIKSGGVFAHKMDDLHEVVVTTASGKATVTGSPAGYVYTYLNDPGSVNETIHREAVASVYYYFKAARDYHSAH